LNKIIPYVNLSKQWKAERKELLKIIDKTLTNSSWIGGEDILSFENKIKKLCNTKYCCALNSGTDALVLALKLVGVKRGDEVITPPNSFIASTSVIDHLGAIPKFVDVLDDQNIDPKEILKSITSKTKAIMPVHLTGRVCKMDEIVKISKEYNIPVIEDSAQSIGSKFKNKMSGSFGKVGCFSAHPLKNLNAMGDGGYLTTNDKNIFNKVKDLINHGMTNRNIIKNFGYVSRMDTLQAAVLIYRLKKLPSVIKLRRRNANIYINNLDLDNIYIPKETKDEFNTYHTFVIQTKKRDKLKQYLFDNGIATAIHYPIPIHLQPASKKFGYKKNSFINTEKQAKKILTLPIHQYLEKGDILKICRVVNKFYKYEY
tara:strand:+ start:13629 stop:14741 length:1113 start_codon:yes stop_codon:yes gene_type:complete